MTDLTGPANISGKLVTRQLDLVNASRLTRVMQLVNASGRREPFRAAGETGIEFAAAAAARAILHVSGAAALTFDAVAAARSVAHASGNAGIVFAVEAAARRIARAAGTAGISFGATAEARFPPLREWLIGATYADWDPRQLDRQFTTSVGPTNVASNGDAVGLLLGGSQFGGLTVPAYLAAAAELVTNGVFASGASWTSLGTVSFSGGAANWSSGDSISQTGVVAAGKFYFVTAVISAWSANSLQVRGGGNGAFAQLSITGTGTRTCIIQAGSSNTTFEIFAAGGPATLSLDSISVKELPGYHALQSTSGDRPQYQSSFMRGDAAGDNLLTTLNLGSSDVAALVDFIAPASVGSTQYVFGANGAGNNRFGIAILTSGIIVGRIGDTTDLGGAGVDARTKRVRAGLSYRASDGQGKLYTRIDGVVAEFSFTASAAPVAAVPLRLLGINNNGTAGSTSGADLGRTIVALGKTLSLTEFTEISATYPV